jgi:phosphinothricin acetyltransferase
MIVRPATIQDAPAMAAIYSSHVLNGAATFEDVPPSVEEMAGRLCKVQAHGLPWVAAEAEGRMLAFAYAGPYNPRSAYRYTVEDSVYWRRTLSAAGRAARSCNTSSTPARPWGCGG